MAFAAYAAADAQDIDTLTLSLPPAVPDTARDAYLRPVPATTPDISPIYRRTLPSSLYSAPPAAPFSITGRDVTEAVPGWWRGSSAQWSMPGLMGVRSATLGVGTTLGPLDLHIWGEGMQIGYFHGYRRRWGAGAEINIQLSEKWNLTLFGSVYSPLGNLSPAIAGFLPQTSAGAYFSYDFHPHWGISLGAQTVRSDFDRRWRMQPIIMPYYRVNKNLKIGADIGGILYNLLYDSSHSNPTIPPPF